MMRILAFAALCAGAISAHAQAAGDLPAAPGPAPLLLPKSTGPIPLYSSKASDVPPPTPAPTEEESWCSSMKDSGYRREGTATPAVDRASELYMRAVFQQIRSNWKIPRAANDPWLKGASLLVRFRIDRDGTILDPTIMVSSGRRVYDVRALDSVKSSSPLAPIPQGLTAPFKVCFRFSYNEEPARTEHLPDPFAAKPQNPLP